MFGIEIVDGAARSANLPGLNDHERSKVDEELHPVELVERALWEIAAHGGNVSAACRSLDQQGIRRSDGRKIPRSTMSDWKTRQYRNRYQEILRVRVKDINEVLGIQAQANALQLGAALDDSLRVTLAGLAGANGVEASQILRNIAQARNMEITKAQELQGTDGASQIARGLKDIADELAGLGRNIVKVEAEDPETGVLDSDGVREIELPEIVDAELAGDDDDAVAPTTADPSLVGGPG